MSEPRNGSANKSDAAPPKSELSVSVAICTNRPGRLTEAVRSVLANQFPDFELVVVAQGGDWAPAELQEFRDDPRLRIIADAGRGLSHARNIAVAASTGELILFTDDDCVAAPDWVAAHVAVYAQRPELSLLFGVVEPPATYSAGDGTVPAFDPVRAQGSARSRGAIVLGMGANMSVRRSALRRVGLFDEQLGAGAPLASGEDLDYALRVVAAGFATGGDPRPRVVHEGGLRAHGGEDRVLWRRDGLGMGAVTIKCVRSRNWQGASAMAGFFSELGRNAATNLATGRTPSGARMAAILLVGAVEGVYRGLRHPLDEQGDGVRFKP